MDFEMMKRTLHWSLRHMLDDREPSIRQAAARDLLDLGELHAAELRDITIKAKGEEARTAFSRLLALQPQDVSVSAAYCEVMWRVPQFAERAAWAFMETNPGRNTYHAVIGGSSVSLATRRQAWERLRPTLNVHDVIRLHNAAGRKEDGTTFASESAEFAGESFETLLSRGATNEDLRILCLYVDELRERTWQLLIARGPTREDLEWTARSNREKWEEAKAMLARGEYVAALKT